MTTVALRPYQEDTLTAIAEAEQRGIRRQIIPLPTGAGKTVVFASLVTQRREPTLILVYREELVQQPGIDQIWRIRHTDNSVCADQETTTAQDSSIASEPAHNT